MRIKTCQVRRATAEPGGANRRSITGASKGSDRSVNLQHLPPLSPPLARGTTEGAPRLSQDSNCACVSLPAQLGPILNDHSRARATDDAEGRRIHVSVRIKELRVVKRVERFEAELPTDALGQSDVLEGRQVIVGEPGRVDQVPAGIPESALAWYVDARLAEYGLVAPLVSRFAESLRGVGVPVGPVSECLVDATRIIGIDRERES